MGGWKDIKMDWIGLAEERDNQCAQLYQAMNFPVHVTGIISLVSEEL